jgi:hypothetical protein
MRLIGELDGKQLSVVIDEYHGLSGAVDLLHLDVSWIRGEGSIYDLPIVTGLFTEDSAESGSFVTERAIAVSPGGTVPLVRSVVIHPIPVALAYTPVTFAVNPGADSQIEWSAMIMGQGPFEMGLKEDGKFYPRGASRAIGTLIRRDGKTYFIGYIARPGGAAEYVEIVVPDNAELSAVIRNSAGWEMETQAQINVVEMFVDTNRDNRIDSEDAIGKDIPISYIPLTGRGALVLPNVDDDGDRTDGSDQAAKDMDDVIINGEQDHIDMEFIHIRRIEAAPSATVEAILEFIDSGDSELCPLDKRVRVFGSKISAYDRDFVPSAKMAIGPGKPVSDNLAEWLMTDRGYHALAVEGITPGMEAVIQLTVRITESGINNGRPIEKQDRVRIRVCPFLPIPATRPIEKIIRPMGVGGNDPQPVWDRVLEILQTTPDLQPLSEKIETLFPISKYPQDQAEFGYALQPSSHQRVPIALGFNLYSNGAPARLGKFVGSDKGSWNDDRWKLGTGGDPGAMGGNLEVSPSFENHPFGVTLIADTERNSDKLFSKFMKAQEVQSGSLLVLDFTGLNQLVHVDEIVSFIPASSGFVALVTDLDLTMTMFSAHPEVRVSAEDTYGSILEKFKPGGIDGPVLSRYKTALSAIRGRLEETFGSTRVIGFPALPENEIYSNINVINLVVLSNGDTNHLIIPDPRQEVYKNEILGILTSTAVGMAADRVHFIDTGVLNSGGGEIHCGTNAIRSIPPIPE